MITLAPIDALPSVKLLRLIGSHIPTESWLHAGSQVVLFFEVAMSSRIENYTLAAKDRGLPCGYFMGAIPEG